MSRIFYLIPDFTIKFNVNHALKSVLHANFQYFVRLTTKCVPASGGLKILFRHCEMLNEIGLDARPLLFGSGNFRWLACKVEPVNVEKIGYDLSYDDVVVVPEFAPYQGLKFKNARKVIFVQNWSLITPERGFYKADDFKKSFYDLGFDAILSCGKFVSDFLKDNKGDESVIISNSLDHDLFKEAPELRRENRIMYLPRKNLQDAKKIIKIVKENFPAAEFIGIDNVAEERIAKEYQKADIFLATGYPEGSPLPPQEAMACGCAVVGFTGGGGSDYMIDNQTALVAKDGDCQQAAEKLLALLTNKDLKERIRKNGIEKSKEFTMEKTKEKLREFFVDKLKLNAS